MKVENYSIGSDVEVFLKETNTGEIVSAEGIAKGEKHLPFVFDPSNEYFATSLDNVLYEFCIPPAKALEDFVGHMQKSINYVKSTLPESLSLEHIASTVLNEKWLSTENAQRFGCDPDFNAWRESCPNPRPDTETNLRSSGFHIHIGYDNPNRATNEALAKAFDLFAGIPSIFIDPDTTRRRLYGKAGSYRRKPYGMECRILSGYFASSKELMEWVFNSTIQAIEFVNKEGEIDEMTGDWIQMAINNNDKNLAQQILQDFKIVLP